MLPIHMGLFKFWFLHVKYEEDYEKKTYIINHIPISATKGKYCIDKKSTNMGA
jgi:hypothetical protein